MEGIVNFDAINAPPSASLSRSPSSGSTLDQVDHHASTGGGANGGFPEHWNGQRRMSGPMLLAGSRRGSLDPNGYLPSSSPANSDSGSMPMGIPGTSGSASGAGRKQSAGNASSAGSASTSSHHPNANANGGSNWASHAGIGNTTQSPISPMSVTPPTAAGAGRPGLLRSVSAVSGIQLTAAGAHQHQNGRRPSNVQFEAAGPGSGSGSATGGSGVGRHGSTSGSAGGAVAASAGAWTAPDSWAVKAEAGALDHDSSEEEVDEQEELEDLESEEAMSPAHGHVRAFGAGEGEVVAMGANGRPATSNGRPGTKSGRPGTADGMRSATQKPVSPGSMSRAVISKLTLVMTAVHDPNLPTRLDVLYPSRASYSHGS